ncbi:MAG: hypothetical protein KAS30_02940 [Candidatus Diapherotrites archaeon]|nr:hypothetical protein [Candidatus Diapherotrites archaeon]
MSDEMVEKAKQYYQMCLKLKELNEKISKEKEVLVVEKDKLQEKLDKALLKLSRAGSENKGVEAPQSNEVGLLEKRILALENTVFGSVGQKQAYGAVEEKFFRSKIIDTKTLMDFMKENFSEKDFNVRELTDAVDKKGVFGEVPFKELKRRMRFVVPKFSREGFIVRVEKGRYKLNKSFVAKSINLNNSDNSDENNNSSDNSDYSNNEHVDKTQKSVRSQDIIIG